MYLLMAHATSHILYFLPRVCPFISGTGGNCQQKHRYQEIVIKSGWASWEPEVGDLKKLETEAADFREAVTRGKGG